MAKLSVVPATVPLYLYLLGPSNNKKVVKVLEVVSIVVIAIYKLELAANSELLLSGVVAEAPIVAVLSKSKLDDPSLSSLSLFLTLTVLFPEDG